MESDYLKKIGIIFLVGIIIWSIYPKLSNIDYAEELLKINKSQENLNEVVAFNNTSIENFQNIKIGDNKEYLLSQIGKPARIDESEYNFKWYVYNQYNTKFAMVGVYEDKVVALYSNSMDSIEMENIKLNKHNIDYVRENYEPLEYKRKGNTRYIINSQDQYDIIKENNKYITVFYDIYENNRVCSYQIIDSKSELSLDGIYPKDSEELRKSFELQVIDLTNSVRQQYGLNKLEYSLNATDSSRLHSEDMMKKNYFDHINKENETPFDRMKDEGIEYIGAGENIAAGQASAIYAHEAWMDSKGHRKNILGDYKYIGVGIVFGGYYTIYYTQNFYI